MRQWRLVLSLSIIVTCAACAHHPAKDDTGLARLSNEAMDFSPQGSDSGKIPGLSTVHFDYDRAVVKDQDRARVTEDAQWIKSHPNVKVQIEGHCDARGSNEYNLALGERRAKAVQHALVELGVPASQMSTISYGEERPLVNGDTEEAYAQNRRVNFVPLSAPVTHLSSTNP